MGQRRKPWTEEYISRRTREGKGQGEGHDYQPWITVQSFASRGTQSRIPNAEIGSSIHVMSYIERWMYLLHRHRGGLRDYRAQFAFDREVTLAAADALGIRHPLYPKTKVPLVMTLDALVTHEATSKEVLISGWDAKPHSELAHPRTLEKLSLHRAACSIMGISHHIFTEKSVPRTTIRCIEWVTAARVRAGECAVELAILDSHKVATAADLFNRRPRKSIDKYCTDSDSKHGLEPGTTLRAVKQLMLEGHLPVDITLHPQAIMLLRVPVPSTPLLPREPQVVMS